MTSNPTSDRRTFLKSSVTAAAALSLCPQDVIKSSEQTKMPFRFVHLTDIHVQPELSAAEGYRKCIAKINALNPRPDFAITGGDLIMDALHTDLGRAKTEFDIFDECSKDFELDVYHTIGNHDVVGWSSKGKVSKNNSSYGKRIFTDRYGHGKTYRSFDHKGWHFIILDSIGQNKDNPDYFGHIDDAQMDWLKNDLINTGTKTPIVVVTHIPFLSTLDQNLVGIKKPVPTYGLVTNYLTLRKLFVPYNVQLVLSGHGHIRERIEVMGTTHIQSGAVCGKWWKGRLFGESEAFGVVTCKNNSFEYQFQDYGWTAKTS